MRKPLTVIKGLDTPLPHRPGHVCVVRYGGIGDVIQASSLFPLLVEVGWKVMVNCRPRACEWLKADPHVDGFLSQTAEVDASREIGYWYDRLERAFGWLINLSGSIEGSLLWHRNQWHFHNSTQRERHRLCNVNYLERTHDLAGLAHRFNPRFFPTPKERAWAVREGARLRRVEKHGVRGVPLVMITLSGSSVHKAYQHWDSVIKWLLEKTPANVVLVGNAVCQILERGWERYRRVKCRSGRWSVRETLTMAEQCDLVVGTETGVMNAVGMLSVPKVLLLSHSSIENLSRDWKNTINIVPGRAPCHPCHKMHVTMETCAPAPNGNAGALCSWSIHPEQVCHAIGRVIDHLDLKVEVFAA